MKPVEETSIKLDSLNLSESISYRDEGNVSFTIRYKFLNEFALALIERFWCLYY